MNHSDTAYPSMPTASTNPAKLRFAKEGEKPLVSICIIVYNLEEYIAAAVDSVLMQETDFPCEFIIGEDCSKDNTMRILESYEAKYPIKILRRGKNLGYNRNWESVIKEAKGDYIAFFEGDDCWIDPHKLSKQLKVLEKHPEAVLCYTNSKILDTKNPDMNIFFTEKNKPAAFKDRYETIRFCPMPTNTIFFRNKLRSFPDWALTVYAGDYMQVALLARWGGIYYLDEVCGLHIHHYHGMSRTVPLEDFYSTDAPVYLNFPAYFDHDPKMLAPALDRIIGSIDKLFHMRQFKRARALYWKLPFKDIFKQKVFVKEVMKQGIKIHLLPFLSKGKTYR